MNMKSSLITISLSLFFFNMPIIVMGKTLNSNIDPDLIGSLGTMIGGLEHCRELLDTNTPDKPIEKYYEEIQGLHQRFSSNEGYMKEYRKVSEQIKGQSAFERNITCVMHFGFIMGYAIRDLLYEKE